MEHKNILINYIETMQNFLKITPRPPSIHIGHNLQALFNRPVARARTGGNGSLQEIWMIPNPALPGQVPTFRLVTDKGTSLGGPFTRSSAIGVMQHAGLLLGPYTPPGTPIAAATRRPV